jgi:hypothetical protein
VVLIALSVYMAGLLLYLFIWQVYCCFLASSIWTVLPNSPLLSSPLLSFYFYVCQQLLLFVLPMMKLSKAKVATAFFPNSPLSSPLFCR